MALQDFELRSALLQDRVQELNMLCLMKTKMKMQVAFTHAKDELIHPFLACTYLP